MLLALSLPPLLETFWKYEILSDAAIRLRNQFQRLDQGRERLGGDLPEVGEIQRAFEVDPGFRAP